MAPGHGDDRNVVNLLGRVRAGVARMRHSGDAEALVEAVRALDNLRTSSDPLPLRRSLSNSGHETRQLFAELAALARPSRPRPHTLAVWVGGEEQL